MKKEVTQWEYIEKAFLTQDELNEKGKNGWELIGDHNGNYLLKRPKGIITMELEETKKMLHTFGRS